MLVRDVLYGDIVLDSCEESIIKTRSFHRLRNIKQLAFSEYVYPTATHNRYSHSLGVAEVITRMCKAINDKVDVFSADDIKLARQIALCHDLGHSPFSHSSEVLSDITHEGRLCDIFELERQNISADIDLDRINGVYNPKDILSLTPTEKLIHDLMDNFVDADKIDYLQRDAYFCGIEYGKFDRDSLINALTVTDIRDVPMLAIESRGIQALESLIFARYYMFNQVYFHPTRRLYDKLFVKYMQRTLNNGKYPNNIKKFLAWDDTRLTQNLFKSSEFSEDYKLVADIDCADFKHEDILQRLDFIDSLNKTHDLGLIYDIAKKSIVDYLDNIYVHDDLDNSISSIYNCSPLLASLKGKNIHKLRVFIPSCKADKYKQLKIKF